MRCEGKELDGHRCMTVIEGDPETRSPYCDNHLNQKEVEGFTSEAKISYEYSPTPEEPSQVPPVEPINLT